MGTIAILGTVVVKLTSINKLKGIETGEEIPQSELGSFTPRPNGLIENKIGNNQFKNKMGKVKCWNCEEFRHFKNLRETPKICKISDQKEK